MFAQIYTGCKCGETWQVEIVEDVDTENDEVYPVPICRVCNTVCLREKVVDGYPVMHALTEEEAYWDMYTDDDETDEWERE